MEAGRQEAPGQPAPGSEISASWGDVELVVATEDIRAPVDWDALDERPSVIVNLAGRIRLFEAELDGGGLYLGPPTPGEMSVLPAGRRLAGRYQGESITYASLFMGETRGGLAVAPRLKHRDEFLFRGIERLARLARGHGDAARMAGESLAFALRQHLRCAYTDGPAPVPRAERLGSRRRAVAEYVEAHLADKLTLELLADVAGLGVREFLAAFREAFGTTPAQYVIDRRLDRARWLLLNTARDVATIAARTGFSSHAHLTDTMRKRQGVTPRAVRGR